MLVYIFMQFSELEVVDWCEGPIDSKPFLFSEIAD